MALKKKDILGQSYLLINYGAHQVLDCGQWEITGLQVHGLPGQSDLQQEGDPMEGATGVGRTWGAVAPVGEPLVELSRRSRRGWVERMERVQEGPRKGRGRGGRHWVSSSCDVRKRWMVGFSEGWQGEAQHGLCGWACHTGNVRSSSVVMSQRHIFLI